MTEPIFMFDGSDPKMHQAYREAQSSFRYFWRELSWERRRIIPGLDMTAVKLPFTDGPRTDGNAEYEQMWIGDVDFDGDSISGNLLNSPNWLTSVSAGDQVSVPFSHLSDWMMAAEGRVYGGFTVNLMRSRMGAKERAQHDQAWGLDFGDPTQIRVEITREPERKTGLIASLFRKKSPAPSTPESFHDHPMCVNMQPKIEEQLREDPGLAGSVDEGGWTLLQREALAGNQGVVKLLLKFGADANARTPNGHTAADLAQKIGWPEIAALCTE